MKLLPITLASGTALANVVPMSLHHSRDLPRELQGRDTSSLVNKNSYYALKLGIGTPPQDVYLQIDTGSSDTWVGGQYFTPDLSSTYKENLTDPFSIMYGDGSSASGNYAQDTVSLGDDTNLTLRNANFAYSATSKTTPQVCGIGLTDNESSNHRYSNLPVQLKEQGHTTATVYAMRLGTRGSPGQLTFGGLDHSQYDGQLQTVPLVSSSSFTVALDSVRLGNRTIYGTRQNVLLDSGTTNLIIPADMADAILDGIQPGRKWIPTTGYTVDCAQVTNDKYFELEFSGARILLPFTNIVSAEYLTQNGEVPTHGTCGLGIQTSTGSLVILGDRFLTSAYVVYDLDNREVSLANARATNDLLAPHMESVGRNGKIPGAVRAPGYLLASPVSWKAGTPSASEVAANRGSRAEFTYSGLCLALLSAILH